MNGSFAATSDSDKLRPVVFDYGTLPEFFRDLLLFYKKTSSFSLRQRTAKSGALSQALISQILNGKRQLTRDNFPALAVIFKLTKIEQDYIERQLWQSVSMACRLQESIDLPAKRQARNHILADWLHPYVKDLVNLNGFLPNPQHVHQMLHGIASPERIKKSMDFLLREGFWRRNLKGDIVPDEASVVTTNEIPNENIRAFHKKALDLARRGIVTLPSHRRKAATILISLNKDKMDELRGIVDSFQQQLFEFIEKNPDGKDHLVQVAIHLTPIGYTTHEKTKV
ncbi:MAG: DUF4423 domain-containing protein [Pseudobdellovibrionaceae bacterium]